jgi:hypothetical protein
VEEQAKKLPKASVNNSDSFITECCADQSKVNDRAPAIRLQGSVISVTKPEVDRYLSKVVEANSQLVERS